MKLVICPNKETKTPKKLRSLPVRSVTLVTLFFPGSAFYPHDVSLRCFGFQTLCSLPVLFGFLHWFKQASLAEEYCGNSSFQFSCSVVSDSLWPHGLQHARLPCPSLIPGDYSDSCPLSWWCHPTISPSSNPFSSHLQSFPASGSFTMSRFFASGGQSIGVSASGSVLPMNIQDWFPLGWTGWIPLQSKGLSKSLLQHHSSKASILRCSAFFLSPTLTSIYDYWKNHSFD